MTGNLFLFNEQILHLEVSSDPRLDPSFPLSQEQYDALTVEGLMQLLREECHNDPQIEANNPQIVATLCSMLKAKGGVNCVKVHWDGYGVSSRHGAVPEPSLKGLVNFQLQGKLTGQLIDETIWSQLDIS